MSQLSQAKGMVPSIITTATTADFLPDMKKLAAFGFGTGSGSGSGSGENSETEGITGSKGIVPTLAQTTLDETAAALTKKSEGIATSDKAFEDLTIGQIYNNTIKTSVSIINDISELVSEKETLTNTEMRRRLVKIFLLKERRMYIGILLILLSFVLYFIDSSA